MCLGKEALMFLRKTRPTALIALAGAVCVALLFVAATRGEVSAAGTRHEDQRIGQAFCDAWASHDPERVVAIFTKDAFYEDVPFGLKVNGSAELRDFARDFFTAVPDLRIECVATAAQGGHGSIEWTFSGTDRTDVGFFKTGKPFKVRAASVFETRHGKISRNLDYYDVASWMRQVGLLP